MIKFKCWHFVQLLTRATSFEIFLTLQYNIFQEMYKHNIMAMPFVEVAVSIPNGVTGIFH